MEELAPNSKIILYGFGSLQHYKALLLSALLSNYVLLLLDPNNLIFFSSLLLDKIISHYQILNTAGCKSS